VAPRGTDRTAPRSAWRVGMSALTVGVEEEYQLVDPESGELRSRADQVLEISWTDDLEGELQDTMVEVQTPPSSSMAEIAEHLRRRRLTAAAAAAAEDLEIVAAGAHPYSDWRAHALAPGERPEMLAARFGRVVLDEHTFGTHVHVALPERVDSARLLGEARWLTPLLIALSASSPFFQSADTGYASYRSIIHRRYPLSGPPPALRGRREYDRLMGVLTRGGLIPDPRTVYWSVRLSPTHPTIEFRGADACPSLPDTAALAAIARAAVALVADGGSLRPRRGLPQQWERMLLDLNEWQAARYGLDATIAVDDGPDGARPLRQEVDRILALLEPVLADLGDRLALDRAQCILDDGNAADIMRRVLDRTGDMIHVMDWLRDETQAGLYRGPAGPA
jgi:glutamate---cysteine ligase / carboxylate-amine ligase